ncbi:MAG: YceD family protein [Oscillospiraceae bacterium]
MVLQLKQLFDIEGEVKKLDFSIDANELDYSDLQHSLVTPIAILGEIENRAGIVELRFNCKFTLHQICDRCLKEFDREYDYSFNHTLIQSGQNPDDEYVVCPDYTLDINQLAISDLLLQLPTKILCRDDCRGLCYVCGQDLNEGECNCS